MNLKEKRKLMESLGKDAIIYFDMDGVLAVWEEGCTYERTCEPGYFFGLEFEASAAQALCKLHDAGFKVCILSAAYTDGTARADKDKWLEKYGLSHIDRMFVECRKNKADFIDAVPGMHYILLDDFNYNLLEWSNTTKNGAKFTAVKFLNGINGGSDKWKGRTVYFRSDADTIASTLADFAVMA